MTAPRKAALLLAALLDANEPEHNANCATQPLDCPVALELATVAEKMLPRVAAAQAEARAELLADIRERVEGLFERWGFGEHEAFCVPARECSCRHRVYVAILAELDGAS